MQFYAFSFGKTSGKTISFRAKDLNFDIQH